MAKKHLLMVKTFINIMFGSKKEINFIIPDMYAPNVFEINYEQLKQKGINNLIFDIDNTIAFVDDLTVTDEIEKLFVKLKKQGFNIILMSNNSSGRVVPVAKALGVSYLSNAGKPDKKSYDNVLKMLKCDKKSAVAIGDQMITDIAGAKKYGIYTVLVDQLSEENNIQTGTAKKLQDKIVRKLKKKKLFEYGKYY